MKVRKLETVKDFREYAKNRGYRGYSRLKKDELGKLISKPPPDYEEAKMKKDGKEENIPRKDFWHLRKMLVFEDTPA